MNREGVALALVLKLYLMLPKVSRGCKGTGLISGGCFIGPTILQELIVSIRQGQAWGTSP